MKQYNNLENGEELGGESIPLYTSSRANIINKKIMTLNQKIRVKWQDTSPYLIRVF